MGMIYTRGTISGITHADRDNGVNPFQRAADLIEFEDSSAVRTWISTNSLTIITRDQAQAIYDAAVASSQDTGRPNGYDEPPGYSSDKPAHLDLRAKAMTLP